MIDEEVRARNDWLRLAHHRTNAILQEEDFVAELLSYVEEKCIVFARSPAPAGRGGYDPWDEECQAEHERLHSGYKKIVESRVAGVVGELGISRDELIMTLQDGVQDLGLSSHPLDAIEEVADFGTFRRMMVERNLAMHSAASRERLEPGGGGGSTERLLGSTNHRGAVAGAYPRAGGGGEGGAGGARPGHCGRWEPPGGRGGSWEGPGGGGGERRVVAVCRACEAMVTPPAGAREFICGSCRSVQSAGPAASEPHVRVRRDAAPVRHSSPHVPVSYPAPPPSGYPVPPPGGYPAPPPGGGTGGEPDDYQRGVWELAGEFCAGGGGEGLISYGDVTAAMERAGGDRRRARGELTVLRESMEAAVDLSMESLNGGGGGGGVGGGVWPRPQGPAGGGGVVHRSQARSTAPEPRSTDSFIARADFSETSRTLHDLVAHAHRGGVVDVAGEAQWQALQRACKESGRTVVVDFSDKGTEEGRGLGVVMENLAIASPGAAFVRVDTRTGGDLAMVCGIERLPAVQVYKHGALLEEMHDPAAPALYDAVVRHAAA